MAVYGSRLMERSLTTLNCERNYSAKAIASRLALIPKSSLTPIENSARSVSHTSMANGRSQFGIQHNKSCSCPATDWGSGHCSTRGHGTACYLPPKLRRCSHVQV